MLTSGFFNSKDHDRKYDAKQFGQVFDGLIQDGVYEAVGQALTVKPDSGMRVSVGTGRAWFNNTWTYNDSSLQLSIPSADTLYSRVDAVVLEVNNDDTIRENVIKVVSGTPASSPVKPVMVKTVNKAQYPLAWITVAAGATSITTGAIQNAVGSTDCPFVKTVMKPVSFTDVFNTYDGQLKEFEAKKEREFLSWFDGLQTHMSGDQAAKIWAYVTVSEQVKELFTRLGLGLGGGADMKPTDVFKFIGDTIDVLTITKSDLTLRSTDCELDNTHSDFPYRLDISMEGVTDKHVPSVQFTMGEKNATMFAPFCKTEQGKVRLFCRANNFGSVKVSTVMCIKEV